MRRKYHTALMAGLMVLAPVLAGCADFDMDSLDIFHLNEKKKLPGERKEVFPGGVPGVTQGIPPEYLKGNQQQADTAQAPAPDGAAALAPGDKAAPPAAAAKTAAIEPAQQPDAVVKKFRLGRAVRRVDPVDHEDLVPGNSEWATRKQPEMKGRVFNALPLDFEPCAGGPLAVIQDGGGHHQQTAARHSPHRPHDDAACVNDLAEVARLARRAGGG